MGLLHLVPPLHAGVVAHENGAPQGEAGDQAGDNLRHLGAGGHRRHRLGVAKLPHHEKVHSAIQRLQHIGQQKRTVKVTRALSTLPLVRALVGFPWESSPCLKLPV